MGIWIRDEKRQITTKRVKLTEEMLEMKRIWKEKHR